MCLNTIVFFTTLFPVIIPRKEKRKPHSSPADFFDDSQLLSILKNSRFEAKKILDSLNVKCCELTWFTFCAGLMQIKKEEKEESEHHTTPEYSSHQVAVQAGPSTSDKTKKEDFEILKTYLGVYAQICPTKNGKIFLISSIISTRFLF